MRDHAPRGAQDILALRSVETGIDEVDPPFSPQQALELARIREPFFDALTISQAVPEDEHPERGRILGRRRPDHPHTVGIVDVQHTLPVGGTIGTGYLRLSLLPFRRHRERIGATSRRREDLRLH